MKRQRCKICKRAYGYYGDLGCVHIWQDLPWKEIEKLLEEYEWEPGSKTGLLVSKQKDDK